MATSVAPPKANGSSSSSSGGGPLPVRNAAAVIALTRQATANAGGQSIHNGKSALELMVRAGELAANIPAGSVPAAQILRVSADRSMMRDRVHSWAANETRTRMTHAVADSQGQRPDATVSAMPAQRYVKKSSLLNKVLESEGGPDSPSKRRKLREGDPEDAGGTVNGDADPPTRAAQLERGERRCINRGGARDPRTHEIAIPSDASARAILDAGHANAVTVPDRPINPSLIQTREPLAEPSAVGPARPYDGAIRPLKTYTEPIIDRDPLAALVRDVALPLEQVQNPADQPENEDAVSGGYTPTLYWQIMRLKNGSGYEQRIRNALNSRKRLQRQQIPDEILDNFYLRSAVGNAPESLIRQLATPLSTTKHRGGGGDDDDGNDLFLGHRMYEQLSEPDQEEVRRTYAGLDSLVQERKSIDTLGHLFAVCFSNDGVAVSDMLPASVKERYANFIHQYEGDVDMEHVNKLLGRPPTYQYGLDIHAAAENAERMARNVPADVPHPQTIARRMKEKASATAIASALQKAVSCITSALVDDMKRNTPGMSTLLGEQQHQRQQKSPAPPHANFITRTSAPHVAAIGAASPMYSVCELTYSAFAAILETLIVDPQEGVPSVPLCKNDIHCECNRLVARHDGTVSPDAAPSAPACNGHAPIAVDAKADEADIPMGKSDVKRFIGKAFYPPGTPVYKSTDEPRPCLLCHWKDVNAIYHKVGVDQLSIKTGEEGYTPPPNMFTVTTDCANGFRSDKCLPRIMNGRPSGISGNVPIYHPDCVAYRRISVPNPLKPGQDSKVHRVVLVGMDFRPSSPK